MAKKETPIVFVLFGEGFVDKTESVICNYFEDFFLKLIMKKYRDSYRYLT